MNKQAVYHKAKSSYCYAYNEKEIHIRIKTAKNDCQKIEIVYGDKYEWHHAQSKEMNLEFSDRDFDYFTVILSMDSKRLSYYFKIYSMDKLYIFTEYGFLDNFSKGDEHSFVFHYPFINKEDIHEVPDWVKEAVFYQIFPDRFAIGNHREKSKKLAKWDSKPKHDSTFGGDLAGIIEKLPYLKDLGINAIYMTPIFKSTSNHKYNTNDYFELDEDFGTKNELRELVNEAHNLGIKVVLDAVFNHSGEEFFAFKDLLLNQENSKYKDWFHVKSFPINFEDLIKRTKEKGWKDWYIDKETGKDILPYHTFAHTPLMPKLNTENKELKEYLLEVAKYWIREFDIDGWRLDVANEVDHQFWREFRIAVKEIKPEAYIVGEIWHDSTPWLQGDQYDSVMNYALTNASIKYFAKDEIDSKEFSETLAGILMRYSWQVNEVMLNLLDSHDTARFINKTNFDTQKLKLAELFMFTFIGAPMLYYGTEIGMTGEDDPDCRKGMIWDESKWDKELLNFIKNLIKIRKENEALTRGNIKFIGHDNLLIFQREYNDKKVLVVINNTNEPISYEVPSSYKKDEITGNDLEKSIIINAFSGNILA